MTHIRLVERELEDHTIWLLAGLVSYRINSNNGDFEHYLKTHWRTSIKALNKYKYWQNGRHEGSCTKQPSPCQRCTLEGYVDEAKELLNHIDEYIRS